MDALGSGIPSVAGFTAVRPRINHRLVASSRHFTLHCGKFESHRTYSMLFRQDQNLPSHRIDHRGHIGPVLAQHGSSVAECPNRRSKNLHHYSWSNQPSAHFWS
jgi:hypothetical protein